MKSARLFGLALAGVVLALFFSNTAKAQPFGAYMVLNGTSGYVQIPNTTAFDLTSAITIEAWVSVRDTNGSGGCSSIIGKGYTTTWWVGLCGTTFRSFLKGTASLKDGGVLNSNWNHIAVTYDGTNRRHFINGEQVAIFAETGPLPTNTAEIRIGSDVNWQFTPTGAIDEVRLWSVARTVDEIRGSINVPITSAQPGLVSVWSLNGNGVDAIGGHNGGTFGSAGYIVLPVALNCGSGSSTSLCLSNRFSVTVSWRDFAGNTGVGTVVPGASADSGIFWFFAPNAWEVLAKVVNGCGLNSRYWAFGAATTNVFYRLEFFDVRGGANKIYFNYPGVASPAITDAAAFATCP